MSTVPFISWLGHGAANLSPPGVFTDATITMFAFDADAGAMQQLADKLLNPAGGGTVEYRALLPLAMVSFSDIACCTSGVDVAGWVPGRECALWVPLVETHPREPLRDRLVFWSPYIFINYAIGMVVGRESWGWPKTIADICLPGADDARYRCVTMYFPTLSADTQAVTGPLLQVVPRGGAREQELSANWRGASEANAALTSAVLAGAREEWLKGHNLLPPSPCIALKQFRDAADPQSACYQAICDSPIQLTAFKGGGLRPGQFDLEITACDSHQVVHDLLGGTAVPGSIVRRPIRFAAWLTVDFMALPGNTIVVAG
jgi:hypothetical protein